MINFSMKLSIQLSRYVITGAMTTLIDLFFLYIFVEYAHFSILVSTALAFIIAVLFSFTLNSLWTFEVKKGLQPDQFLRFFLISTIGLILTLLLMYVLVEVVVFVKIYYLVAKILTSIIVLGWNFIGNSLWTFNTKNTPEEEESFAPLPDAQKKFPFEVSVVIPAYNEEKRILKTLQSAEKYFNGKNISWQLLVVNDGGKDKTVQIVEKFLAEKNISGEVLNLEINQGKGGAVREGFLHAKGKYILFADADGATPFTEYEKLQHKLEEKLCHFVIGSRYAQKNAVEQKQPLYRIVSSRIGNFFLQIFLINGVLDTQCGFKLFRNEVGKKIFSLQKIKRFAFDVEILVLAKKLHYKYTEVAVQWADQNGSTFSFLHGIKSIVDFIRIKFFVTFNMYEGEK